MHASITEGAQISVAVGITIGLIASFVQSLGLTIQRKSHVVNQALPEAQQRVEHRRPLWLLGFAVFISSNILGSVFQIAALPVVILGPLGAVSLLWNAFFARLLLGDVFSPWMILGTLFIAGGAVLIAVFGIFPEPNHTLDDLLVLLRRPGFVVYFSILLAVVVISLIVTHIIEHSLARQPIALPPSPPLSATIPNNRNSLIAPSDATIGATISSEIAERTPLLRRHPSSPPESFVSDVALAPKLNGRVVFVAISYASFSGILSGMCLIFAKAGVELLMLTVGGKNQFWRWEAWVLILGLVIFALLQLWYLHKSLVLADPTLVCPLAFCFYNLSSIFNGLVYFDQFSALSTRNLCLVILGICVLLGGVWVVSIPTDTDTPGIDIGTWTEGEMEEDELEAGEQERVRVRDHARQQSISLGHVLQSPTGGTPPLVDVANPFDHVPAASPERSPRARDGSEASGAPLSPRPHGLYNYQRRRPSVLINDTSPHLMSPPLATAGLPAGGFSIGLSPMSPGFSLVPRGRDGRRVSGHGKRAFADVVRARMQMRRTMSEGDMLSSSQVASPGEEMPEPRLAASADLETGVSPSRMEAGAPSGVQRRWTWLKRALRRE